MEKETGGASVPRNSSAQKRGHGFGHLAAQCNNCFKWRLIPTLDEYEEIRSKLDEDPYVCEKKAGMSCEDPADIEYNNSCTWVSDKPNIPKTPKGFHRNAVLRRDYSKMDVTYTTPDGKSIRSMPAMITYLQEHPDMKDVKATDFCFASPKLMVDTIPPHVERKGSASNSAKRIKKLESDY